MFYLTPSEQRPEMINSTKDESYHVKFARYCIGQCNNYKHTNWLNKIEKNKRFYVGNQWSDKEDIDTFLKDDNNEDRNRLSVVDNIIRPMIIQYRGNAIRMNISYRAKSVSPMSINRREIELGRMKLFTKVANDGSNPFAKQIKKNLPVGDNEAETAAIFRNTYVDKYVRQINNLLRYVSERNRFIETQDKISEEMALSGCAVMKTFEYAGHQEFKIVPSENYLFDNSCIMNDHSDAAFWGDFVELTPPEIYEICQNLSAEQKKAVDNFARLYSGQGFTINGKTSRMNNGRVPLFTMYWRDTEVEEYGYVKDQYGYNKLTKINYVYEGETTPRYTDKDLVKVDTIEAKRALGGQIKKKRYFDVLRTCQIIPKEILGSVIESQSERDALTDIIGNWGIAPYQETETMEYNSVKSPYKVYCWGYIDGEIMSPVDDAIDPQRLINRTLSIAENQMNNSRGSGTVYDKDLVEDEKQLLMDINQSRPIGVRTKGLGVQNVIGSYDGTVKNGTTVLFNIIDAMKSYTQKMTGVNDALKGEFTGSDQLVGVTQLMIQRGSLMQEPFYNAITQIYRQCFQSICTVGKRIYCDNERNLAIAVGDEGAEIIRISKDMRTEDFRVFIKRENSDEMLAAQADQMILLLKDRMMIDDKRAASLWGRSNPDEVAMAIREYAAEKEEISRMSQKNAAAQEQQLMQKAEMEQQMSIDAENEALAREDIKHLTELKAKQENEVIKQLGKFAGTNKKAENILIKKANNL